MKRSVLLVLLITCLSLTLTAVKSPEEFFGKKIGDDRVLVSYPRICEYFAYLDEKSDRLLWKNEGNSTLGQPMYLAAVSSPANLARLEELIEINRLQTNPDQIQTGQEETLLEKARTFVLITATIHSTEIAASQMALLLAHQLVSEDSRQWKEILEEVVLLLMPSINPDGNVMVTDWYQKYLGTSYEGSSTPFLYHHYAGHDTNRDFYMLNLKETQVVNRILHHRYFPHIFLDMHQMGNSGPRMFVPPFKDPFNANLSPLMLREIEMIGAYMAKKLQEEGKKGVANAYGFDAYWPGGSKNTAWYKNVIGILTELASVAIASPIHIDANELRGGGKGLPEYKPQVNFPDPWPGGWWRLRDIIDYEMTACRALLEIAALDRKSFLRNYLDRGRNSIELGLSSPPHAWLIPQDQWDEGATLTFLRKMAENGVRLFRAEASFQQDNLIIREGDFIIPMDQPYRPFIAAMMEKQRYPEILFTPEGPMITPYDSAGWTLPLLTGVRSQALQEPPAEDLIKRFDPETWAEPLIEGAGDYYLIPARNLASFKLANRLLDLGLPLQRVLREEPGIPAGDFLLPVETLAGAKLLELAGKERLVIGRCTPPPGTAKQSLKKIRLAVFQPHIPVIDEGWTRWVLDNYGFSFSTVKNSDLQDKSFAGKYDLLIIPSMNRSIIVDGKYSAAAQPPHFPPAFQGGIGKQGLENLLDFVRRGGRLVLLDAAYEIARQDFKLPIRNVLEGVPRSEFYCPGSILRLQIETTDPLGWGCREEGILFFAGSAAFRTDIPREVKSGRSVAARFAEQGPHLLSGYLLGEKHLDRTVAAVRFSYQQGEIVVLGGRMQYRGQSLASFKLLFNSIFK